MTADSELAPGEDKAKPAATKIPSVRNLHKLLMLITTFARMGLGLLSFIILARYLGPHGFGIVATAMAYSGFITLVSDFGFGISALREAAGSPEKSGRIIREALIGKIALTVAITVVAGTVVAAVSPAAWWPVYALIHVGSVAYSLGELMLIAPRADRRFDTEAKLVLTGNVMMLVLAGIPVALTGSPMVAAAAFAGSRLLYMAVVAFVLRQRFALQGERRPSVADVVARLRGSVGYAADAILTTLSMQVDVLMFGAMLTPRDVGVYQAGARLVQAILPVASVLSTVYMPTLAAAAHSSDTEAFRRNSMRLNYEFVALAILGGLGFAFVGPIVTKVLYGSSYDSLLPLWGGFGAFVVLRFAGASYGIQLAAIGHIRARIAGQIASIVLFVGAVALLLPSRGLGITTSLLALSALPVLLMLGGTMMRDHRSGRSTLATMVMAVSTAVVLALSGGNVLP